MKSSTQARHSARRGSRFSARFPNLRALTARAAGEASTGARYPQHSATPSPQVVENTWRKKAFYSQHAAIKNHRKPLKTRLDPFLNRNNSTPFFRTESEQKEKVRAEREGLTWLDQHRGEFAASQLIENKARKNAFYSARRK